jgi:predicted ATP-binding protein involved in virulence
VVETIKTYAEELKDLIEEKYEESLKITQQLDNSYPGRLISEKNKISEDDYNKRFAELNTKQERLTKNGLYESKQEALEYSADDAKALLVYLDDLEKKLNVFDDLLEKLDLFTSILNERRFTYKTIHIDSEKGFYFKTSKDKELELGELSSGEQHEVVLLYELIFNTAPNNMVLIDEPEISLHVAWQKEFVKDLLKIIELQGFQVMMATHSPSIINDRWDLVHVLEKKEEA